MSEYIYVKLTKKWGGFKVGDVVRFGTNKGEARIAAGEGVRVEKQKEVNPIVVETATLNVKAKADAKAKVRAEAMERHNKRRKSIKKKGG